VCWVREDGEQRSRFGLSRVDISGDEGDEEVVGEDDIEGV
jgi:hypothetical protein